MVYWLVQLVSIAVIAVSSGWWQGSKIKRCERQPWGTGYKSMGQCTQACNCIQFITDIDQS